MTDPGSSKRLRLAEVAPLFASIPPVTYGGTERIVHNLTEELVRRGHDVTLFATGDSRTSARLVSIREEGLFESWEKGVSFRWEFCHVAAAVEVLRRSSEFDVIHFHMGALSAPFAAVSRTPTLHSMPSPLRVDDIWTIERFPEAAMTARSHSQITEVAEWRRRTISVVHNGCDFNLFSPPTGPGRYLAFLGTMSAVKNPRDAILIARRAGFPIVLAGEPQDHEDRAYFDAEVRPLIDGKAAQWIGTVCDRQKNELLHDAAALLFPIEWEEAFGIVMIEAMACGVPVLAYERGSVPEVVDLEITGYYGDTVEELAELVPRALRLDRMAIREHARRRFSREVMTDGYMKIYESLTARIGGSACA
jgi:glycosyltransferase involved in cell wall biosynthesis